LIQDPGLSPFVLFEKKKKRKWFYHKNKKVGDIVVDH
jgi:hypothetical protein